MTRWLLLGLIILAPTLAQATLPTEEQWREELLTHHVGFGSPTGGAGGTLCTVTTLADSGTNSLRDCATRSGPQWIIFSVSGTITLSTLIQIGPNKTIDGRGADIMISGTNYQLWINGNGNTPTVFNVIIHNIRFDDLFHAVWVFNGTHTVWLDHLTIGANISDEAILVDCNPATTVGTYGITISWSRFLDSTGGSILVGANNGLTCNYQTEITFHHNYYDNSHARLPLARFAQMHSFNSYMKHTQTCPPAQGLCIGAQITNHAQFISENDIFECLNTYCSGHPRVEDTGINEEPFPNTPSDNVKVTGQWSVTGDETYETKNPDTIFTPSYSYTPATANATLRDTITHTTMGAGRVDNPYNYLAADSTPPGAPTNLRVVSP